MVTQAEIETVRNWAKDKLKGGSEPPWSWYQYMKLVETLDAILAGMSAVSETGDMYPMEPHIGKHLRLVDPNDAQTSVQTDPGATQVHLPI